jgi:hypothetical protein
VTFLREVSLRPLAKTKPFDMTIDLAPNAALARRTRELASRIRAMPIDPEAFYRACNILASEAEEIARAVERLTKPEPRGAKRLKPGERVRETTTEVCVRGRRITVQHRRLPFTIFAGNDQCD